MKLIFFNCLNVLIFLISLLTNKVTGLATKFHSKQRNQALNKIADLELTAPTKTKCLSLCQHNKDCQALNVEKLSESQHICHLFYFESIVNITSDNFITKTDTTYFYIKLSSCQDAGNRILSGMYQLTEGYHFNVSICLSHFQV